MDFKTSIKTIAVIISMMACSSENALGRWFVEIETEEPIKSVKIMPKGDKKELKIENIMCNEASYSYKKPYCSILEVEDTYASELHLHIQLGSKYIELLISHPYGFRGSRSMREDFEKEAIKVHINDWDGQLPHNNLRGASVRRTDLKKYFD